MCISDWSSDVCSSYLLALDEHTNGAVGQLQKLEHGGDHADVVEIVALRIVLAGIELGDEEDFLVAFHRGLERGNRAVARSEEQTSELQSLMRLSSAVFCLKKKKKEQTEQIQHR